MSGRFGYVGVVKDQSTPLGVVYWCVMDHADTTIVAKCEKQERAAEIVRALNVYEDLLAAGRALLGKN